MPNDSWAAGRSLDASCISCNSSVGTVPLSQPKSTATPGLGRFGTRSHVGALAPERDELIVDVPIAHAVGERVDPSPKKPLRILQGEYVGRDAEIVPVGLVYDRAVQHWGELLVLAVCARRPRS